jgi:organic hydroperoxide reductase OsmC/OhrA
VISATIESEFERYQVTLTTGGTSHSLEVAPRSTGYGSSANGGELLCLALATCYCNDLYREAAKRSIEVLGVEVRANAEFSAEGLPANRLSYRVSVRADAAESAIRELILHTDSVAEVHNTLRLGIPVALESFTAVSMARLGKTRSPRQIP